MDNQITPFIVKFNLLNDNGCKGQITKLRNSFTNNPAHRSPKKLVHQFFAVSYPLITLFQRLTPYALRFTKSVTSIQLRFTHPLSHRFLVNYPLITPFQLLTPYALRFTKNNYLAFHSTPLIAINHETASTRLSERESPTPWTAP